jgi:hypothetical protein
MRESTEQIIRGIILIGIMLVCVNIASAATYYVNIQSSKCKDSYTTTQTRNISTPWCNIDVGFDNLASGDTLYILTGEYNGEFILKNKDFTANVTIRAYPNNVVDITSYNKGYANGSNSLWTSLGSGAWKTKFSSTETPNPSVYYKDGTKFFTWSSKTNFLNSKYPENTWYDSSAQELYVKFSDTSKNPNKIALYTSNYKRPLIIQKNSISSNAYIILRDLNFKYNSNHLLIDDQSNVIVQDCSFDGGHFGIAVSNHDTPGRTNIIIRNNNFNGRANPVWYEEDMKNEGTEETEAIDVTNHKGRVLIYDNTFTYWHGGVILGTNEPDECNNSEVYNNIFRYGRGSQIEIEDYCKNTKYHHNQIFDSGFAGVSFAPADASAGRCEFYNNVIVAKGQQKESPSTSYNNYAIKAQSRNGKNVENWYIYHNTFYGYGRALNTIEEASSGINEGAWVNTVWKDNIFYAETEYTLFRTGLANDGVSYDYNLYYLSSNGLNLFQRWNTNEEDGFATLADAKASSNWNGKWDIHSKQADPLFTDLGSNNLKPKTGSPACTMSSTGSYVGAIPCTSTPPQNHAPTQSKPLLRASDYPDNTTSATLNCYNQSTSDVDGDKVTNIYRWFRNSTFLSSFTNKTIVNQSYTEVGQSWICEVTPFDGKLYGTAMNSSALLIRAVPSCGDKICNGKENCTTCAADCGTCPLPKITGCVLDDISWNENDVLKRVYNLNTCFNDPLKTTLKFSVKGNKSIKVTINNGSVDLSAPTNWTGQEHVVFYASSSTGNRSASTNNITLTVNNVPVCGDKTCESGETCSNCASDCGACPEPKKSGGGGGGGGGGSFISKTTTNNTTTNNTINKTDESTVPASIQNIIDVMARPAEQIDNAFKEQSELENTAETNVNEVSQPESQITGSAITEPLTTPSPLGGGIIIYVAMTIIMACLTGFVIRSRLTKSSPRVLYAEPSQPGELSEYVSLAMSNGNGHEQSKIESELITSGLTEESVNDMMSTHNVDLVAKALEECGYDCIYAKQLHNYVKEALKVGYDWRKITHALIGVGWAVNVVESLLKTYSQPENNTVSNGNTE